VKDTRVGVLADDRNPRVITPRIHSFPPIAHRSARLLILGSMPGVESLRAGQYYAHPRNALWRILGDLLGAGPEHSYARRCERLQSCGVALWDVLASCSRQGSLDTAITDARANDFVAFFADHPHIRHIAFNGATAETSFRRLVMPTLDARLIHYQRLPSTSPAHAALSYAAKREIWALAFNAVGIRVPEKDK
jgi:hypoxanthine-DNA glycosylase